MLVSVKPFIAWPCRDTNSGGGGDSSSGVNGGCSSGGSVNSGSGNSVVGGSGGSVNSSNDGSRNGNGSSSDGVVDYGWYKAHTPLCVTVPGSTSGGVGRWTMYDVGSRWGDVWAAVDDSNTTSSSSWRRRYMDIQSRYEVFYDTI